MDTPYFIRVIDFETATADFEPPPQGTGICEVGWCDVSHTPSANAIAVEDPESKLCNPGCPISPVAMAAHHITEAMVANEPLASSIIRVAFEPEVARAAHNKKFDQQFVDATAHPIQICTWKCAHRLWPHAPGFGNHALRYWLGLDLDPELWRPSHRAGPDAYVTASILAAMLRDGADVEELIQWSSEPVLLVTCTLGKQAGKPWAEIDEGFLRWLTNKENETPGSFDEDTVHTAWHYLKIATSGETL